MDFIYSCEKYTKIYFNMWDAKLKWKIFNICEILKWQMPVDW